MSSDIRIPFFWLTGVYIGIFDIMQKISTTKKETDIDLFQSLARLSNSVTINWGSKVCQMHSKLYSTKKQSITKLLQFLNGQKYYITLLKHSGEGNSWELRTQTRRKKLFGSKKLKTTFYSIAYKIQYLYN